MPHPGFFNQNAYITYPFLEQADLPAPIGSPDDDDLPESIVVDFGAIMGVGAGYADELDSVYLHHIVRNGSALTFEFRTNCPGASETCLLFTRQVADPENTMQRVEATLITGDVFPSSDSLACTAAPLWEGFLVTGPLSELLVLLPGNGTLTFADGRWQLEPARVQNLSKSYVAHINLANVDRTHVFPPPACQTAPPVLTRETFVNATCLTGVLVMQEGYNCALRQEAVTNSLIISAALNAGAGPACDEVPIYPAEIPPLGSNLLTGGPACPDVLKTINGVGGRIINLIGQNGVRVTADAHDPHGLVIHVDLTDFASCLEPPQSSLSSASAADS